MAEALVDWPTMTDTPAAAAPAGPSPVARAIAMELVTKHRLRIADQHDSRLGPLGGFYELSAATWTGKRSTLVAFYSPPSDSEQAQADVEARVASALAWGAERMTSQSTVERCDILLVALGTVTKPIGLSGEQGAVKVGAVALDPSTAEVQELLPVPGGLPGLRDLRGHAKRLLEGAAAPTLAAVDLAERQTMQNGYHQPARRALDSVPMVTYSLMGVCIALWLLEEAFIGRVHDGSVITFADFGAALNFPPYDHQWWRYVSSMFLHSTHSGTSLGVFHIAGNMYALFMFGRLVEQMYGRLVFLVVYLATGVLGGLLWEAASSAGLIQLGGSTLGASGGIAGLLGFLLLMGMVQGKNVPVGLASSIRSNMGKNLIFVIVFWFFLGSTVNNYAHGGGVAAGAALACILPPLASIGGRDLRIWERLLIYVLIAAAAIALLIDLAHLLPLIVGTSPAPPVDVRTVGRV